jgi:transcriptional regulator GlxA family with amidase domain
MKEGKRTLGCLLFPGFELLDVFGPLEMFGVLPEHFRIVMVAEEPGVVASAQGPEAVAAQGFADCPRLDLLLVPGGIGTRREVDNPRLIAWLRATAAAAELTMSVCTGAGLLARAGVLDGRRATTNKRNFAWPVSQGPRVDWVREARWVDAGDVLTSSGVSAGMDMALAVIARLAGPQAAELVALNSEYEWHRDPTWDPFAKLHGLVG